MLCAEVGDEVATGLLPDEADLFASVVDELGFGEGEEVGVVDEGGAGGGDVEAGEDVEEGGFAGAGGADDGEDFAATDGEVESAEGDDFKVGDFVDFEEVSADDVVVGRQFVGAEWYGGGVGGHWARVDAICVWGRCLVGGDSRSV